MAAHVTLRLQAIFARSNWYKVLPMLYKDMGAFGTGTMAMMEDPQRHSLHDVPIGRTARQRCARPRADARARIHDDAAAARESVRVRRAHDGDEAAADNQQWQHDNVDHARRAARISEHNASKYDRNTQARSTTATTRRTRRRPTTGSSSRRRASTSGPIWRCAGSDGENVYGSDCPGMMAIGDMKQLQR
jgi:hypothetical protein